MENKFSSNHPSFPGFNNIVNAGNKAESQEFLYLLKNLVNANIFNKLSKGFSNNIKKNLMTIYFPQFTDIKYLSIKDIYQNNPLHLACQNSHYSILDNLDNLGKENLDYYLKENNSFGISGYLMLKEKSIKNVY